MEKKKKRNIIIAVIAGVIGIVFLCFALLVGSVYYFYTAVIVPVLSGVSSSSMFALAPPDIPATGGGTGTQIPYDWTIHDLDGRSLAFSTFEGRVTVLNIWATWCPPCVAEMPSLQLLHETMGDRVHVVCVTNEDTATVKGFARKKRWSLPLYTYGGVLPDVFKARTIPTTFVIGADGGLMMSHRGSADWAHDSVIKYLNDLAGPDSSPAESERDRMAEDRAMISKLSGGKLGRIVFPKLTFKDVPLPFVLQRLTDQSRFHDPLKEGIRVIAVTPPDVPGITPDEVAITMDLRNVRMDALIIYIGDYTGMSFRVTPDEVRFAAEEIMLIPDDD